MKNWMKHETIGMAIGQHKSTEWHFSKSGPHLVKRQRFERAQEMF
jgi:hypothetical protein